VYAVVGLRVQGFGFRAQGVGFRVQGVGFRVEGVRMSRWRGQGARFRRQRPPRATHRKRIFVVLMTSDRQLKASREGSK